MKLNNQISFQIKLDNPCQEYWDTKTPEPTRRHCKKCNKTVVDMTLWSELDFLNYFKNNSNTLCGRLYEEQINQTIEKVNTLYPKQKRFKKLYALLLSLFIFNKISTATSQNNDAIEIIDTKEYLINHWEIIKISGTVTNEHSEKLLKVRIEFNNQIYFTDAEGKFEIKTELSDLSNGLIVFTYERLSKEVRNYNVVMNSTIYEIQMHQPRLGRRSFAGGITASFFSSSSMNENFVTISKSTLDLTTKKTLDDFAMILRSNPNFIVDLQTFITSPKYKKQALTKALLVKKYLVEINGIDDERLMIVEPKKLDKIIDKNKVYFETPSQN